MSAKKGNFSRRNFIKTAGAAGLGSVLIPLSSLTQVHGSSSTKVPEQMIVPTRPFGKTGVNVSILTLGGILKISDQLMFRQAFKMVQPIGIRLIHMDGEKTKRQSANTLPSSQTTGKKCSW